MELQDDLSETNEEFKDNMSQLSKESHEQLSARVNDWVNNSPASITTINQLAPEAPVVESNQELTVGTQPLHIAPTTTASNENAASSSRTFADVQNIVTSQTGRTTEPVLVSIATTELLTQPTNTFAGLHSQPLGLPGQTDLLAINSAAAGLILNIASILPHSWPSMSIASAPTIAPPQPNPINTLLVNRILPNLSTWSFPVANTSQQSIVTSVVPPPAIATSLPTIIPINNSVLSTAPVFPISSGGTVYYVQPTAVVSTTTSCNLPQTSTTFPSAIAPTFVPVSSFSLPQPSVNM